MAAPCRQGTIVGVSTDSVIVDTGKDATSLPISKTIVVSPLPGDFVDLLGHKVQVTGRRRFPPSDITGRVVGVDASHVTIDTDGELDTAADCEHLDPVAHTGSRPEARRFSSQPPSPSVGKWWSISSAAMEVVSGSITGDFSQNT